MENPQIKFTYRDYLQLPEQDRRELIEGDFYMAPAPNIRHQTISLSLGLVLVNFVRNNGLGKVFLAQTDVVLSDLNVVQPDILYISNERREIITENNISGAPDLVVEILSPSTASRDRELKLGLYARFGVREYWIVDPDESSIQVMELGSEGYTTIKTYDSGEVESSVLPGFRIAIEEIFEG